MTAASETQSQQLIKEYKLITPTSFCNFNAIVHAIFIQDKNFQEAKFTAPAPQIWQVHTSHGVHVYLEVEGTIYNTGITSTDQTYPNFSLEQIQANGTNVTVPLFLAALVASNHANHDKIGIPLNTPITKQQETETLGFNELVESLEDFFTKLIPEEEKSNLEIAILTGLASATFKQASLYPELVSYLDNLFQNL